MSTPSQIVLISLVGVIFLACSNGSQQDNTGRSGGAPSAGSGGSQAEAGSGGQGEGSAGSSDRELFVPQNVSFSELADDADEGVNVASASLVQGAGGLEFFASLRNDGETSACSGAMSIELYDSAAQPLGSFNGGIFAAQVYRINDLNQAVACIDPQQLGMAGIVDIDPSVTLDQVSDVIYRFTYFNSEFFEGGLTPLLGFSVSDIERIEQGAQAAFSGSLVNDLDATVREPSVTIFPITGVGRPLGMVIVAGSEPISPWSSWSFQTSFVELGGTDQLAFPIGSIEF